jgi:hypothetical protein
MAFTFVSTMDEVMHLALLPAPEEDAELADSPPRQAEMPSQVRADELDDAMRAAEPGD